MVQGTLEVMAEQSTGRGARGVVAAAAPLAAAIGAEVLRAGGNAYDAVVAAGLAETVLLPPKCGLAGDLVALVARAHTPPEALLAIGGAPRGLAEVVRQQGLPDTGPLSVGVPGAPAGYAALAGRGRQRLADLAQPALTIAQDGFVWAQICTVLTDEAQHLLLTHNPGGTVYLPEGRPLAPGAVVRLPGLAHVLEEFVANGGDLFAGPVGTAVARVVREQGGILDLDDLVTAEAEWVPALPGKLGEAVVWATPAPTHGPSLLAAVADAQATEGAGPMWDRIRRVIDERRDTLGDPRVAAGTSMVSAVDDEGTAVVVVHSNSYPRYGSGLVVEPYHLILNNRAGRGFTAQPGHPNFPAPGRRPATTLHAWAWGEDRTSPRLLGGTPGGANQMPWNAQTLAMVLAGERDPGLLVVAPRWEWLPEDDGARIEEGLDERDVDALERHASSVDRAPRWGLRSAAQIMVVPRSGEARCGAVDPRTGGACVPV